MAKKRPSKKTNGRAESSRRARKPVGHEGGKRVSALKHRVNTIPSNGDMPQSVEVAPETVPVGEAMRMAVEALGDVKIDNDLAPSQLRQLAESYEEVASAQAAYNAKAEAAKVAKKALDAATNALLEKVKAFTHPSPLPLFDQAEDDEDAKDDMLGGSFDGETAIQ